MSITTIERLQRIVADETRTTEERQLAAEHIIQLQEAAKEPAGSAVDPALEEHRSHFTDAQRRLAATLGMFGKNFGTNSNVIDTKHSEVSAISDKLVVMQIIRLMLDDDGNDGVLYAVVNWRSTSKQSLAERMGNHPANSECNPQWRLGMQPRAKQEAYGKRQAQLLKVAYVAPTPEPKLDAKTLVRMSSQQFAETVVNFHRKVLSWDLKQFVYDNLTTPPKEFFEAFVAMQKKADEEEVLFKGAYSAHLRATDPNLGEEEAEDFLELLRWMAAMKRREERRRTERIAKQRPRNVETKPAAPESPTPPILCYQPLSAAERG